MNWSLSKKISLTGVITSVVLFILPFVMSRNLFYAGINAKVFFVAGYVCCLLAILSFWLFSRKNTFSSIRGGWLLYSVVGVLVVNFVSAISGVYFWRSIFSDIVRSDGVLFLSMIGVMIFCLRILATENDWGLIRKSIAFSGGLFSFLTYFGPGGLGLDGRFLTANFSIPGLTFANDTFAGAYILLSIIVTIVEILKSWSLDQKKKLKYFLLVVLVVQCFSPIFFNFKALFGGEFLTNPLALVGSARASALTLFLFLVNFVGFLGIKSFFKGEKYKRITLIWSGVWLFGFLVTVGMLIVPGSFVQKYYLNEESSLARPIVWERAIESIGERLMLGWGPENFQFAFNDNFDNRLYSDRGGREIWFDRAHNFTIDTLVETGIVGLISIAVLIFFFVRTLIGSKKLGLISDSESYVLVVLVFAHIFQIQTSFDTVSTYLFVGVIIAYGAWLENRINSALSISVENTKIKTSVVRKIFAIFCLIVLANYLYLYTKEYTRQLALVDIFRTTSVVEQDRLTELVLAKTSDFESLRLSSASLIKGGLAQISAAGGDPRVGEIVLKQLEKNEKYFDDYLKEMPKDYRARMNYAYLLLIQTSLGKNRSMDAKKIIAESYDLSPQNPLTYALDSLAELYSGDLKAAKAKSKEMSAVVPDAPFTKSVVEYMVFQEKQFPSVSVLKLENL